MAPDIHRTLAGVALVVFVALGAALAWLVRTAGRPYVPRAGTTVFDLARGDWAWTTSDSGCAGGTHRIAFSDDRKVMTITSSRPYREEDGTLDSVATYDILGHDQNSVRGAIRGETRVTDQGGPVVWDLVLRSATRYAWHRTDWTEGALTAPVERCGGQGVTPPAAP